MADNLTITSGDGSNQTSTGNPQNVPTANTGPAANSTGVQPGTASALLTTTESSGVPLVNENLTTVNLNTTASSTASSGQKATTTQAKTSPVIEGFAIALFVIAVIVFVIINRSAKSTTNY